MPRSADETRERILNAAEKLFAERGFHGVTVRQITREAGVDVALANYHFGPKTALYATVLHRRADIIIEERMKLLDEVERRANGKPALLDIIAAYAQPYISRAKPEEPEWRAYFRVLAHANTSPEWSADVFSDSFNPQVRRFIGSLRLALPDCPVERLYWCYHFFSGALTLSFAQTGRVDDISEGRCADRDIASFYRYLIPFVTAGTKAVAEADSPPPFIALPESATVLEPV